MDTEKALLSARAESTLMMIEEGWKMPEQGVTIAVEPMSGEQLVGHDSNVSKPGRASLALSFSPSGRTSEPATGSTELVWCPFPSISHKAGGGRRSVPARLLISRFVSNGREFNLREPVEYRVYCQGGVWVYECPDLCLTSYGTDRAEARRNFNEEFAAVWDNIALADDSALTQDAIELKRKLIGLVASVKDAAHKDAAD